jgi:hypothetical protein
MTRQSDQTDDTLLELADLASRGMLDAEGYIQLDELLLSSRSNLKIYVEYLHLHAKLSELTSLPKSKSMVFLEEDRPRRSQRMLVAYLAIVLVPFMVIGIAFAFRQKGQNFAYQVASILPSSPANVAAIRPLTSTTHWQFADSSASDQVAEGKKIKLDQGAVELLFFSGARMLVEGPAELTVSDKLSIRLEYGRLRTTVRQGVSGFKVETSSMNIVDLGTEFIVDATEDGATTSCVTQGSCRVSKPASLQDQSTGLTVVSGSCVMSDREQDLAILDQEQSQLVCKRMISTFARYDLAIDEMSPSVCIVNAKSLDETSLTDPHLVYLIPEKRNVFLKENLVLQDKSMQIIVPAGTMLDSFLLHFSLGSLPKETKPRVIAKLKTSGYVTFQNPTITSFSSRQLLEQTDHLFSDKTQMRTSSDLEAGDRVSAAENTLSFDLACEENDIDQVRVLVQSQPVTRQE